GGLALEVDEEEGLVLEHRSADLTAVAVVVVARFGKILTGGQVDGVEIAVLEVLIGGAVQGVGSADDVGVELTAGGVAELGRELIGDEGELTDGVVGDVDEGTGDALVVVVDAFDGEVVV